MIFSYYILKFNKICNAFQQNFGAIKAFFENETIIITDLYGKYDMSEFVLIDGNFMVMTSITTKIIYVLKKCHED